MAIPVGTGIGGPVVPGRPPRSTPPRRSPQPVSGPPTGSGYSGYGYQASPSIGQIMARYNSGPYVPPQGVTRASIPKGYGAYTLEEQAEDRAAALANAMMLQLQNAWDSEGFTPAQGDQRTAAGFREALDPRNIPKIPGDLWYAINNPAEAGKAMVGTPEGRGGLLAAALPFGALAKARVSRGAPDVGAADRVRSYPTGKAPATRYPLARMGEHLGFDREAQRQLQVSKAPSVQEHLANLDALESARGRGVEPPVLKRMFQEGFSPNREEALSQYRARSDRPVAGIYMNEAVGRGEFPGLRVPPKRPTLGKAEGESLGRQLGGYNEDPFGGGTFTNEYGFIPDEIDPGIEPPIQRGPDFGIFGNMIQRQGVKQSVRKGSYSDRRAFPMNAQGLADLLSRSGFWMGPR